MKLEAKDRKNPSLVCVSTVTGISENKRKIQVHFDGWSDGYDYWCKTDTTDIHPIGWCERTGKAKLQKPYGEEGGENRRG
jgi:hypothetical protein